MPVFDISSVSSPSPTEQQMAQVTVGGRVRGSGLKEGLAIYGLEEMTQARRFHQNPTYSKRLTNVTTYY